MESLNDILSKPYVIWFIIGLFLMIIELKVPGLVIIFFGVGAWAASLAVGLFGIDLNGQLLVFIITSLVLLVVLRGFIKKKFFTSEETDDDIMDDYVGKEAVVMEKIFQNRQGKIKFRGTMWNAASDEDIEVGEIVAVIEKDNLLIKVKKI